MHLAPLQNRVISKHLLVTFFFLFHTINIGTKGVGDNFQEQFLIIEEDSILYLCISNVLHSPEQFLQTYNRPFSVVMDSGKKQKEEKCAKQTQIKKYDLPLW